jgi:predicted transcriptional regulator
MIAETQAGPAPGAPGVPMGRLVRSRASQSSDSSRLASGSRSGRPPGRPGPGGRGGAPAPVLIELSKRQITRVLRDAGGAGGLTTALTDARDLRSALDVVSSDAFAMKCREERLSTSLVRGLLVLLCLPADGGEMGVTDIAKTVGLSASTTYRYISTLRELGFAERDSVSRKYRRVTT